MSPFRTYVFKKTVERTAIDSSGPIVYTFNAGQIPEVTAGSFNALFDEYKILKCVLKFQWSQTVDQAAVGGSQDIITVTQSTPIVHTCIDRDDADPPASLATVQAYNSYRKMQLGQGRVHKRILRPVARTTLNLNTAGGTLASSLSANYRGWINLTEPSVTHFGVKGYIEKGLDLTSFDDDSIVYVQAVYYIAFRGSR